MSKRHSSGCSEFNVAPEIGTGKADGKRPPDSDSGFTIVPESASVDVDDSHSLVSEPNSKKSELTAADNLADIPSPPPESESSGYPWNYGWAVHPERVLELLSIHRPFDLHFTCDPPTIPSASSRVVPPLGNAYWRQVRLLCGSAKKFANYWPLRYCFVKPLTDDEPRTTETIPQQQVKCADGKPPVSFFMVNSTASGYYRKVRPHKQHMEKLIHFFEAEPCWREDAVESSRWHAYYQFPY